jgi:hypothetical protein
LGASLLHLYSRTWDAVVVFAAERLLLPSLPVFFFIFFFAKEKEIVYFCRWKVLRSLCIRLLTTSWTVRAAWATTTIASSAASWQSPASSVVVVCWLDKGKVASQRLIQQLSSIHCSNGFLCFWELFVLDQHISLWALIVNIIGLFISCLLDDDIMCNTIGLHMHCQ